LPPEKRLDYGVLNARRVADNGWLGCSAANQQGSPIAAASNTAEVAGPDRCVVKTDVPPLSAVWLVGSIRSSSDPARDIEAIDPQRIALVEPGFEQRHTLKGHAPGLAVVNAQVPGRLVISTQAPATNLLVTNQSWHRGWRATIDGNPAVTERVYGDFLGCVVPAGAHQLRLKFQPASLRYGAWVSAAGLACFVLGMAWLARRQRNER